MMPYQAIKQMIDAHINVHTGTEVLYDPASKSIFIPYTVAYIGTVKNFCEALHEAAHAVQHKRNAALFWFYQVPLLRLLIEAHASIIAYTWMKKNLTMDRTQITQARKHLWRGWLTYLWPFPIRNS
jgi:hypothetical protein